jgi:hypothetical protein
MPISYIERLIRIKTKNDAIMANINHDSILLIVPIEVLKENKISKD